MAKRKPSSGERTFLFYWRVFGMSRASIEQPVTEYRGISGRRFRFDFAWLLAKVVVEIDGGTFSGGRHTRGKGFANDCEKQNLAVSQGWAYLRLTPQMMKQDPERWIKLIAKLVESRNK